MKYLLTVFAFCLCMSASAQLIKKVEPIQLPTSLSTFKYQYFKSSPDFKSELKQYTFTIDQLDKMRRGQFIISSKNVNKNFTFLELPTIDLKKELNNIMHKIPGLDTPVRAEGFTL